MQMEGTMKITSSELNLASAHASQESTEVRTSMRAWATPPRSGNPSVPSGDQVTLSAAPPSPAASRKKSPGPTTPEDFKLQLLKLLFRRFLRHPAKAGKSDPACRDCRDAKSQTDQEGEPKTAPVSSSTAPSMASTAPQAASPDPSASQGESGVGFRFEFQMVHSESESVSFSAEGVAQTADGQEISFSASLSMSRTLVEQASLTLQAGDAPAQDPLVLSFDGPASEFSGGTFQFDLNQDGKTEALPTLAPGRSFLVYDQDGNGTVTDASELFGPTSGNGFTELSALDGDQNGWIDESDSAFAGLRLWSPDTSGAGELKSLAEAGVGALSTLSAATPFTLKQDGETLGALRASGVFLKEEGGAGFVQQVDIKV